MSSPRVGWQERVRRVVIGAEWVALALGIVSAIITLGPHAEPFAAAGFAGMWVLAVTATPLPAFQRAFVLDALILGGVVVCALAVTLTGGPSSPFYLLSLTPPIHASLYGGTRIGLMSAVLAGLLLTATTLAQELSLPSTLGLALLYVVMSATVAQIRRILVDLELRAASAEATTTAAATRLEHLENANALLARLAEITSSEEMNPISIGRAALEAITNQYPGSSGVAAINGESGPIIVSRYGTSVDGAHEYMVPLSTSGRDVGFVRLKMPNPLQDTEIDGLTTTLRPLAVAFANARLLQQITHHAVREERTRLARELHDEIGPSLASLGLSLDVALIQGSDQRELTDHLAQLRNRVGRLVDEVRSTVSDLRATNPGSLTSYLDQLAADLPDDPPLTVDVDERRPVRPSLATDIYAIVGEAIRNAYRHSVARSIKIWGWIDFDRGRLVVEDDGTGFDSGELPEGHFGIVGMRERAERSGLRVDVSSTSAGTHVDLEWGIA